MRCNINGEIDPRASMGEVLQENHYYPFDEQGCSSHSMARDRRETEHQPRSAARSGMRSPDSSRSCSGGRAMEDPDYASDADSENRYQYNGKELISDIGLVWLDYGARFYDPSIGRWGQVNPLAENYKRFTPYAYVGNFPNKAVDPDGKRIIIVSNSHTGRVRDDLAVIYSTPMGRRVIDALHNSDKSFYINGAGIGIKLNAYLGTYYSRGNNRLRYSQKDHQVDGILTTSWRTLAHELYHAYQDLIGQLGIEERIFNEREAVKFENYLVDMLSGEGKYGKYRSKYNGQVLTSDNGIGAPAFPSDGPQVDYSSINVSRMGVVRLSDENSETSTARDNTTVNSVFNNLGNILEYMAENNIKKVEIKF